MKLIQRYCYLLLLGFVFPLAAVDGVAANEETRGRKIYLNHKGSASDLTLNDTATHIAQGVAQVTGVEVIQTGNGLELILETVAGSERLVPLIVPEGNDLVIDILDATLAFSIRNGVTELNPASGISKVTVNKGESNSIQVRITGDNQTPSAEVVTGRDDLVLSITPERATAEQESDEQIEVIATGQADDDDYYVTDASSATKTDTPIRDIPQSIQVVPKEVLEDRVTTNDLDPIRTVSGITSGAASASRPTSFVSIRGFDGGTNVLRNGTRQLLNATQDELTNLERIEVLKGPASVLYGQGGIGGTINLVTKQPLRDPFYELSFLAGSFDLYRPSIDISGPLNESETVAYRLNAAYQDAGQFYDFGKNDRWFVAPVINWQIGPDTDLTIDTKLSRRKLRGGTFGIPAAGTVLPNPNGEIPIERSIGEPDDISSRILDLGIGYDLKHQFSDDWSLQNALRYSYVESTSIHSIGDSLDPDNRTLNRRFVEPTNDENAINNNFITTADLVGNFKTGSIEHKLLFGVEYSHQDEEADLTPIPVEDYRIKSQI